MLSKADIDRWSKRYFDSKTVASRRILELIAHIDTLTQKHAALAAECEAHREYLKADVEGRVNDAARANAKVGAAMKHTDSINALERSEG